MIWFYSDTLKITDSNVNCLNGGTWNSETNNCMCRWEWTGERCHTEANTEANTESVTDQGNFLI